MLYGFVKYKQFCDTPQLHTRPTAVIEAVNSCSPAEDRHGNGGLSKKAPESALASLTVYAHLLHAVTVLCGPVSVFKAIR